MKLCTKKIVSLTASLIIAAQQCFIAVPAGTAYGEAVNCENDKPLNSYEITSNNILLSGPNRILPGNSFKIDIAMEGDKYKLHDMKRNTYVIINEKVDNRGVISHYLGYYDTYSTSNKNFTANNDEQLGAAILYNYEIAYDFYENTFGYSGYDGKKSELFIIPNYKDRGNKRLSNAFNLACSEAAQLAFGEGDGVETRSFGADVDTVAHEYTHAILNYKLDLISSDNETNAFEEAYCDIMGEYADTTREWIHSSDIIIGGEGCDAYNKLRDMTKHVVYSKEEVESTSYDSEGKKRYKDGMSLRHAAYWMDHLGIDPTTAAKLWFNALNYLKFDNRQVKFVDVRNALISAVSDVVDPRGRELTRRKIKVAFNKVHIYDVNELPGDICNDGYLDSFDLVALRKYLSGMRGLKMSEAAQVDLNYDGEVTYADLSILQNYLIGRIKEF